MAGQVFSLTIEIDSTGLTNLNTAGQQIGITTCFQIPSDLAVVWVAFRPTLTNTVTWQDDFSVVAQLGVSGVGSRLTVNASDPASGGNTYPFRGGQFQSPTSGLPLSQYAVDNQQGSTITAGVARSVTANGTPFDTLPLNGDILLNGDTGFSTPLDQILVYTASSLQNGLVLDSTTLSSNPRFTSLICRGRAGILQPFTAQIAVGTPLLVDFSSQATQTIHYADNTNAFAPGPLAS